MSLLAEVAAHLGSRGIPHALIGAAAMAIRGVSRSTFDLDLLTTDASSLEEAPWQSLGAMVEIRRGDADDPLAGVVRVERPAEPRVDVVVGRAKWQEGILARATPEILEDLTLPVATAADLVLLKLYAGGPQDLWDVAQLLGGPDRSVVAREVGQRLRALPRRCREAWSQVIRPGT